MGQPVLFDKSLQQTRLKQLAARSTRDHFIDQIMLEDLQDRLLLVEREFETALLCSPFTQSLKSIFTSHPKMKNILIGSATSSGAVDVALDDELWPFAPQSLSLIASLHSLTSANDLPGAFAQIKRSLKPDGLFLSAFLGGNTLSELREVLLEAETSLSDGGAFRVHPMVDIKDAGALLQRAGFTLPVADLERHTVRYGTIFDLLHDLRSMGMTNILTDQHPNRLTRPILFKAAELYAERYGSDDGRISATFDIIWLSGWAPHESQQKPLKPGSATHRMADFLKPGEK